MRDKTATATASNEKTPFVFKNMVLPFALLLCCFTAWGIAANMTDPLVKVFSKVFTMSSLESAFVQFSYYGAYFLLALPAAFINRRYSYKTGVLVGLGLATGGGFLFYPASVGMTYGYFLMAIFALAAGLSILETSANPFVIAMGPQANATRRLNLAQAFQSRGYEYRRSARRDPDSAETQSSGRRRARRDVSRQAAYHSGRRASRGHGAVRRSGLCAACDLDRHRAQIHDYG